MSSDQSDPQKDIPTTNSNGNGTPAKPFVRTPLDYNLLGAGSPSYEARLSFKRYPLPQKITRSNVVLVKFNSKKVYPLFSGVVQSAPQTHLRVKLPQNRRSQKVPSLTPAARFGF